MKMRMATIAMVVPLLALAAWGQTQIMGDHGFAAGGAPPDSDKQEYAIWVEDSEGVTVDGGGAEFTDGSIHCPSEKPYLRLHVSFSKKSLWVLCQKN